MVTVISPPEGRVILSNVSWTIYEALLDDHLDQSGPRFTYDRGVLEIMSPSIRHERLNRLFADLFTMIASEMNIEFDNAGSTTFKRKDLERGFEPDSCFYVQNVERVRGKEDIDLAVDPPPDLLIEIDITSSSLNRFPIFASIGAAEVWRYDGQVLTIFKLEDGAYQARQASEALPGVTSQIITQLIESGQTMKRTVWLQSVREWARTHSAAINPAR
jgi:Uma2 family endonuclease